MYDILIPLDDIGILLVWFSVKRMLDRFKFIFTQNFDMVPCILASNIMAERLECLLS